MTFAAPIIRDHFVFNGDLYIEVENLNRHKRASISELTALLRPAQKPAKSALSAPPADQVGHWYEAQLLHYGLPPSKTKAVAKVRLLDALNAGKLSIPPEILRLENEMKKEYQAADRKARAAHKAQLAAEVKAVVKGSGAGMGKKRKQSEDILQDGQPAAKKAKDVKVDGKDEKPKAGTKKSITNPVPKPPAAKKTAVTKPSAAGSAAQGSSHAPDKPPKKQMAVRTLGPPGNGTRDQDVMLDLALGEELASKGTATKKGSAIEKGPALKKKSALKKESAVKKELKDKEPISKKVSAVMKEPAMKKESAIKKEPVLKKEPAMKKEPAVKKEPAIKKEPTIKKEHQTKEQKASTTPSATTIRKEPQVKKEPKIKKAPSSANPPALKKEPAIKKEPSPTHPPAPPPHPAPNPQPTSSPSSHSRDRPFESDSNSDIDPGWAQLAAYEEERELNSLNGDFSEREFYKADRYEDGRAFDDLDDIENQWSGL